MSRLLLVDDDPETLTVLRTLLEARGYRVDLATSGEEALHIAASLPPDVVVADLVMPGMDGLALLAALHHQDPLLPVIFASGVTELPSAVVAMRAGAEDYLAKPIDFDALLLALERAITHRSERAETENLRRQLREKRHEGLQGLLGGSRAMQGVYQVARQVAGSRATVLITGESGTGKGELARAIHGLGPRADRPFVTVHCAAVPETLLESELFGHERGAFTGAERLRVGRFEQAQDGTIFLDEIGDIPLAMQVKLLRVLQERVFERVGGNELLHAEARVIAATNHDLEADVRAGRFREDLYYRLDVVKVEMPPLRVRGADALVLAEHFLRRFAEENGKPLLAFADDARAEILRRSWPGNVRALENAVERAVVLSDGPLVHALDLPGGDESARGEEGGVRVPGSSLEAIEANAIAVTLEACAGSTARAAEVLGVSLRTLQYKLKRLGLARKPGTRALHWSRGPGSLHAADHSDS